MSIFALMALANPMTWLVIAMFYLAWLRFRKRAERPGNGASHQVSFGGVAEAGLGAAFQFLSMAYRPNHAFLAKAQIQQQEDTDEEDNGGPDTPTRHLHRQLRQIRRGEPVDHLIWRLE